MSKKHHYVPVSKVTAGMVLSENLLDKLGHILLPAGSTLTDNTIKAMAHHHVHQLAIVQVDSEVNDETENKQKKIDRLSHIFKHAPYGDPTDTLKTYIEKYRHGDLS
jgi:hypothetical protein